MQPVPVLILLCGIDTLHRLPAACILHPAVAFLLLRIKCFSQPSVIIVAAFTASLPSHRSSISVGNTDAGIELLVPSVGCLDRGRPAGRLVVASTEGAV